MHVHVLNLLVLVYEMKYYTTISLKNSQAKFVTNLLSFINIDGNATASQVRPFSPLVFFNDGGSTTGPSPFGRVCNELQT
jgi:hypothetical protein